jgi:hypothetical protein
MNNTYMICKPTTLTRDFGAIHDGKGEGMIVEFVLEEAPGILLSKMQNLERLKWSSFSLF